MEIMVYPNRGMVNQVNKMYLVLGDWSDDGHGKHEKVLVEVNKNVEEVQNAYKASCKLTGISFNNGEDYTEKGRHWEDIGKYQIAVEYEEARLSKEVEEILVKHGCPSDILDAYKEEPYQDTYVSLWFWFVSLSLSDMKYKLVEDNSVPNINGFWDKNLNAMFGYGLYL